MELPSLAQPERLLWLLLIVPALYWLAQPPRPRRVLHTAHRQQWLAALATLRRRPPRLRTLRLLLLLLASALVLVASAGPRLQGQSGPMRLLVLLDGSASMAQRHGDGTAFAAAVDRLQQELARVPHHVEVGVLRLGSELQRWSGPAARTPAGLRPPAGALPGSLAEIAAAAASDTALWTITDGQGGPLPRQGALTLVGSRAGNSAIRDVRCRDRWPLPGIECTVTIASYLPAPARATLHWAGAVEPVPPAVVELPAVGETEVAVSLRRSQQGGTATVRIEVAGDALPLDDEVGMVLDPLPAPRIGVLADESGAVYVEAAAAALAAEVGGTVVAATAGEPVAFLLAEGGSADLRPGQAPMATFGVRPPSLEPVIWSQPQLIDWDRSDPLLEGLDLAELWIDHALAGALPPGRPLLQGGHPGAGSSPLAVAVAGGRATSLHFAFRLQDSNLALLPAFPQLLRRALLQAHGVAGGERVLAGPVPREESDLRRLPSAAERPLPVWGSPEVDLGPHCLWLALLLLVLRALLR